MNLISRSFLMGIIAALCAGGALPFARADTRVDFDRGGVLLVDEKPFFPFGWYLTSKNESQRMRALQEIADGGFNAVNLFWSDLSGYDKFLDEAERRGIKVVTELKGDDRFDPVKSYKGKRAVLAWSLGDDAGDHASADELLDRHWQVRSLDPAHLTYLSVSGYSKKWDQYSHAADLIGGQSYPIGKPRDKLPRGVFEPLDEIRWVFSRGADECRKHRRPAIANLQAFRWSDARWPTPDEAVNMTYQALLAGVRGVFYYTYENREGSVKESPELLQRIRALAPEMREMGPTLASTSPVELPTGSGKAAAALWEDSAGSLLLVVNRSSTTEEEVRITIPEKSSGRLAPIGIGEGKRFSFREGAIVGAVRPLGVAALRVK